LAGWFFKAEAFLPVLSLFIFPHLLSIETFLFNYFYFGRYSASVVSRRVLWLED
jgi:hypothetical protein